MGNLGSYFCNAPLKCKLKYWYYYFTEHFFYFDASQCGKSVLLEECTCINFHYFPMYSLLQTHLVIAQLSVT